MSEPAPDLPGRPAAGGEEAPSGPATAGRLLAASREQAGVHLAALAAALKVPTYKLKALEEDRYEVFTDVVFLRALASSICRSLKIDAAPVLALLPASAPVALKDQQGLNARFKEAGERAESGRALGLPISRLTAFVVIVLLAAALVLAFVPRGGDGEASPATPASPLAPAEISTPVAVPVPVPVPVPQSSPAPAGSAQGDAAAAAPAPAQPATPGEASAPAPVETAEAAPEASQAAPAEPLVIVARQQTWVQVRSAVGGVLIERNMEPGERYTAPGGGPWSVVIGRADAAEVTVRGEAMNLNAVARNNVARFEVK
ncbi:RodZ domain-containing protein [Comamonas flocculans]|uniref:Helix-turn-helix domain-containing protein n=1 Tax=Comamonas flocculans TaxID=2597701 RepID=A0A5B8S069_9BURK|nr:RodZ domain-containing protein [Comamonas flocculans]QEA13985.1 helix-turn-helix domain-containing protein [Comamonas flocculans]